MKQKKLKLDKFPAMTETQSVELEKVFEKIRKRLRRGDYSAALMLELLLPISGFVKNDPQLWWASSLMNQFRGNRFEAAKIFLEFAKVDARYLEVVINLAWEWWASGLEKTESNFLAAFDLSIATYEIRDSLFGRIWLLRSGTIDEFKKISPELGAVYDVRLSNWCGGDDWNEERAAEWLVKLVAHLPNIQDVSQAPNTVNFSFAMRVGDYESAKAIACRGIWPFAHERIEAFSRLRGKNLNASIDEIDGLTLNKGLRVLRDKCLSHFIFAAAGQVAEITGEAADFNLLQKLFAEWVEWRPGSKDQVRLLARAFLACHRRQPNDVLEQKWKAVIEPFLSETHLCQRLQTIFLLEAYKQALVGVGNLLAHGQAMDDLLSRLLIAEVVGAEKGMPILESVYALVQRGDYSVEEKVIALCRIAKLKERFATDVDGNSCRGTDRK